MNNDPCDQCGCEADDLLDEDFLKLFEVYGSVAYMSGRDGTSEEQAARQALQKMIERADQIEQVKKLLAEIGDNGSWWLSPLERDERWDGEDDDMGDGMPW